MDEPPFIPTSDPINRSCLELDSLIPDNPNKPYDILMLFHLGG